MTTRLAAAAANCSSCNQQKQQQQQTGADPALTLMLGPQSNKQTYSEGVAAGYVPPPIATTSFCFGKKEEKKKRLQKGKIIMFIALLQ
jgi:hypothetical protein